MPQFYWLDANVFIQAHRRYYRFKIAPGFWSALENNARADKLRSPQKVLDVEIAINKDALANWAKNLGPLIFVPDGKDEQRAVGQISAYVLSTYPRAQADPFLAKADPWVIAHALVNKGIVVTEEQRHQSGVYITSRTSRMYATILESNRLIRLNFWTDWV